MNKEQQSAVCHVDGPMLVLAGPGSGKTRVLTERIRYLIEERHKRPEELLVITFSQKAAKEMQDRFFRLVNGKSYPVNFGTFHAVFYHILTNHFNYSINSILKDNEKRRYIKEIGLELGIEKAIYIAWQDEILSMISSYKNLKDKKLMANICNAAQEGEDEFYKIYCLYVKKCNDNGKIDFDDMLIKCKELLLSNEEILRQWQNNYKYIFVDEFQDINDIQYEVLKLLAGDRKNVFAVGDDDQSIYAFRGANPKIMRQFLMEFEGCKKVYLSINYRCAKNIIYTSDTLIRNNVNRIDRNRQMPFNDFDGKVHIIETSSTVTQAEYVCDVITDLVRDGNYNYSDFAVLYRSAHCSTMLTNLCNKRMIPIANKEGINIYDMKEFKVYISYIKASCGLANRLDYFQIVSNPYEGISREAFCVADDNYIEGLYNYYKLNREKIEIINILNNDLKIIRTLSPVEAFEYLLNVRNIVDINGNERKIEAMKAYLREYNEYGQIFVNYEKHIRSQDENANSSEVKINSEGVHFMTAHASKGLEFPVVFIIGLQEGEFPHNKNLHGDSVEEERRLMYVAMTRAKQQLFLVALNTEYGKQKSRFIQEIMKNQSFISSYSTLSRNSSKASATASYSSSSSI